MEFRWYQPAPHYPYLSQWIAAWAVVAGILAIIYFTRLFHILSFETATILATSRCWQWCWPSSCGPHIWPATWCVFSVIMPPQCPCCSPAEAGTLTFSPAHAPFGHTRHISILKFKWNISPAFRTSWQTNSAVTKLMRPVAPRSTTIYLSSNPLYI